LSGEPRPTLGAAALYTVLAVILAYPFSLQLSDHVLGPPTPDTKLFLWMLSWDTHAFTHQPLAIFDANIYYPLRHTLAFSENLIGSALVAAPVIWTTGNPVLAMNLVTMLSVVLSGTGVYVLGRRVGLQPPAALLAGIVYAFTPPRFLRLDQLHLATLQWMPFCLAALHAYLDTGRRRHLRLAALFFSLQALTSGHGVAFLALAVALLIAYRLALGEPIELTRRVVDFGVPGALLMMPAVLVFAPYLTVQDDAGLRRTLVGWNVAPSSFLASPAHLHARLLSWFPEAAINQRAGAYLFPGFLTLALAALAVVPSRSTSGRQTMRAWHAAAVLANVAVLLTLVVAVTVTAIGPTRLRLGDTIVLSLREVWRVWAICLAAAAARAALARRVPLAPGQWYQRTRGAVRVWRNRTRTRAAPFYALLTIVTLWLMVGPPLGLWQFVYWLPGFSFIREHTRFILLGVLGLAVLAGAGFERLVRVCHLPRRSRVVAAAVGLLLLAEFAAMPLGTEPYRVVLPAVDRWLATEHAPFVVAEVPLPDPADLGAWEGREAEFMLHSTAHWQKTVHGYSGTRLPVHLELFDQLTRFPDDASVNALARLGVTYVVVHTDLYEPGEWSSVERRLRLFGDRLRLVHEESDGRVYAVIADERDAR
jgi:hypothetical protein